MLNPKPKDMKLTKVINRKVGDQIYYKHMVTVPNGLLKELGWTDKTRLKFVIDGKDLKIKKI